MITIVRRALVLAVALVLPASAFAQAPASSRPYFISSSFAVNTGGDTVESSPAVGIAGGWLGPRSIGLEGELAWSPEFFEQDGFRITRRMPTFMLSGLVQLTYGTSAGLQPYAAIGFGMVRPHLTDAGELNDFESTEAGFNVGGGAMWVKRGVGIRGDVRYMRIAGDEAPNSFGVDLSDFGFWRISTGLVVKF
jgi:hypothetical protein